MVPRKSVKSPKLKKFSIHQAIPSIRNLQSKNHLYVNEFGRNWWLTTKNDPNEIKIQLKRLIKHVKREHGESNWQIEVPKVSLPMHVTTYLNAPCWWLSCQASNIRYMKDLTPLIRYNSTEYGNKLIKPAYFSYPRASFPPSASILNKALWGMWERELLPPQPTQIGMRDGAR